MDRRGRGYQHWLCLDSKLKLADVIQLIGWSSDLSSADGDLDPMIDTTYIAIDQRYGDIVMSIFVSDVHRGII